MVAEKKQRGEKMPQPFGKRIGKTGEGNCKQAPEWSMGAMPELLGAL